MKLYIIELLVSDKWCPIRLYKGELQAALKCAREHTEVDYRVRRVSNQAERGRYLHVSYTNASLEPVDWVK